MSFCAVEAKARTWKSGRGTDTLSDETDADRKAEMPEDSRKGRGGTSPDRGRERQASAAVEETSLPETTMLLEEVLRRENLVKAYHRVRTNKGAPGVDGMTVDDLKPCLKQHWPRIKEEILTGSYQPQPARRVDIPKPGGRGVRSLGIPNRPRPLYRTGYSAGTHPYLRSPLQRIKLWLPSGKKCPGCGTESPAVRGGRLSRRGGF